MPRPTLIVVTGPPAGGKTTIARELGAPTIELDLFRGAAPAP